MLYLLSQLRNISVLPLVSWVCSYCSLCIWNRQNRIVSWFFCWLEGQGTWWKRNSYTNAPSALGFTQLSCLPSAMSDSFLSDSPSGMKVNTIKRAGCADITPLLVFLPFPCHHLSSGELQTALPSFILWTLHSAFILSCTIIKSIVLSTLYTL